MYGTSSPAAAAGWLAVQQAMAPPAAPSCWVPVFVRGPHGGSDPSDLFVVGDVARFTQGGEDPNKYRLNAVKAQVAADTQAALAAAPPGSTLVLTRRVGSSAATPLVMVAPDGKQTEGAVFGTLPLGSWTPHAPVLSTTSNFGTATFPGSVVASFNNGTALVAPVPQRAVPYVVGTFAGDGSPASAALLAAAGANTDDSFGPLGVSLWDQLQLQGGATAAARVPGQAPAVACPTCAGWA